MAIPREGLCLPRLYAIADRHTLDQHGIDLRAFAEELRDAGVRLVQYRDKRNEPREVLRAAGRIADVFSGTGARLILNDRADLAALIGWGLHVGQGDLPVEAARRVLSKGAVIGVSTHNDSQVVEANASTADYVALGPVFPTASKADPEPLVGVGGIRRARTLTEKPLVAIGGVTAENSEQVWEAGADSVAVIGALIRSAGDVKSAVKGFVKPLRS